MKHISVLIKPASSLCNLRCTYCFYANVSSLREVRSFGKMKSEVASKMIEHIYEDLEEGDQLTMAFQGGEPTLAGLSYFRMITQLVAVQKKDVKVHYAIQTNGTVINQRWCEFLKEHHFLVGLSIDGMAGNHDLNRVDTRGRGTFQRVLQAKRLFDVYQIEYNILCVLTNSLALEVEQVYSFLKDEQIEFVQFIPCLADLDVVEPDEYALTPKRFAYFYQQLFSLWYNDLAKGRPMSIKLFDDLLNLLVNQQITACGILGNCQVQYVIEADGSVYPCDFYVLDHYRIGYIQEQTLRQLFSQNVSQQFVCEKPAMPAKCMDCPFQKMCRGGCKRMKDAVYVDQNGFCGYQDLLATFVPKIEEILYFLQERSI